MLIEHRAVCAATGIRNKRFLFQLIPFLGILIERQIFSNWLAVNVMMADIFFLLFQLAPGAGTYVFTDGLAILIYANLYAATVFARLGFLCHETSSLKGRERLYSVLGNSAN